MQELRLGLRMTVEQDDERRRPAGHVVGRPERRPRRAASFRRATTRTKTSAQAPDRRHRAIRAMDQLRCKAEVEIGDSVDHLRPLCRRVALRHVGVEHREVFVEPLVVIERRFAAGDRRDRQRSPAEIRGRRGAQGDAQVVRGTPQEESTGYGCRPARPWS